MQSTYQGVLSSDHMQKLSDINRQCWGLIYSIDDLVQEDNYQTIASTIWVIIRSYALDYMLWLLDSAEKKIQNLKIQNLEVFNWFHGNKNF